MIMTNRPIPTAHFSPVTDDRVASLRFPPGAEQTDEDYLPPWLLDHPRLPRPLKAARTAEQTARVTAEAAARVVIRARREAREADAADARAAARDGVAVNLQAQADRAAAVSQLAAEHRAAGVAHKAALQALIEKWEEHRPSLRELVAEICQESHETAVAAVTRLGEALTAREGAYRFLGRPGADLVGQSPDRPGQPDGARYWARRPSARGFFNAFGDRLNAVREVALAFPIEEVEAAR